MPKFTLVRTCLQYYTVEADSLKDAFEKYAAGEATLDDETTLDCCSEEEESDEEE